jgi:hypothetical protein
MTVDRRCDVKKSEEGKMEQPGGKIFQEASSDHKNIRS